MVRFDDFSGGLWIPGEAGAASEQAGFAIPASGLLQADNVDYLPDGAVRGRRGCQRAHATPRAGAITALARFHGRVSSQEHISGFGFVESDPEIGGRPWANASGAADLDLGQSVARVDLIGGTSSEYLTRRWAFGINQIPGNATVTGLRVRVWFKIAANLGAFSDGALPDGGCRITQGGTFVGAAQLATWITYGSRVAFTPGAAYPFNVGLAVLEYGGAGNTWGLSAAQLTPAALNDPGFGVGYRVQQASAANALLIDFIEVTAYYSAPSASRFLVGHDAGGTLVWETLAAGSFAAVPGGSYADPARRPWVVSWPQKNALFIFDGLNPAKVYDGFELRDVIARPPADGGAGIAPKKGPFACLHRNRLYVTDPGELQYSVYGSDINDETNWRPRIHLAVNDARGGVITGLASFVDSLIIFKDTALFVFNGDPEFGGTLFEFSPDGCVAPDTIQVTPFGVLYLARDGVRLTDGQSSTLLSQPVGALFRDRLTDTTWRNAVALYVPRLGQYLLKLDPAAAEGYVLHRVAFPTDQGEGQKTAWSRIPSLPMNAGVVWAGSEDEGEPYVGDLAGIVWQRDVGALDDGAAFFSVVRTQERLIDPRDRRLGRVYQLRPMFRADAGVIFALRYDQALTDDVSLLVQGGASSPATFQEPRAFVPDFARFGRYVSVLASSTAGPEFELSRVDADVRLRAAKLWR